MSAAPALLVQDAEGASRPVPGPKTQEGAERFDNIHVPLFCYGLSRGEEGHPVAAYRASRHRPLPAVADGLGMVPPDVEHPVHATAPSLALVMIGRDRARRSETS